jgi:hypothetical protein
VKQICTEDEGAAFLEMLGMINPVTRCAIPGLNIQNTIATAPSLAFSSLIHPPPPLYSFKQKKHQNHVLFIHDTSNVVGGYQ